MENMSPIFLVCGTNTQAGVFRGSNSAGGARHKLDGRIDGLDSLFCGFRIGDAEFIGNGDLPIGRAAQAIFVELGEGKLYFPGEVGLD